MAVVAASLASICTTTPLLNLPELLIRKLFVSPANELLWHSALCRDRHDDWCCCRIYCGSILIISTSTVSLEYIGDGY